MVSCYFFNLFELKKCWSYSDTNLLTLFGFGLGGEGTGAGALTSSVLKEGILSLKL